MKYANELSKIKLIGKIGTYRLLGMDVGTKTIGLALSDLLLVIASPFGSLSRPRLDRDENLLSNLIQKKCVGGIVVGLPINMSGLEGTSCYLVRGFVTGLQKFVQVPIVMWDERLSTLAVKGVMMRANYPCHKWRPAVDKLAASYILQGILDRLRQTELSC